MEQKHIVKNIQSVLKNHINRSPAIKYWQQCQKLLATIWSNIDWPLFHWAISEIPLHRWWWVRKFVLGPFAHGKNMQCWHFWPSTSCPCCACPLEDKPHIIQCPAPSAAAKWISSLKVLKQWLWDWNTSPVILEALLSGLQAWYSNNPSPTTSQHAIHLMADQMHIGWASLVNGWLDTSWHVEQEQ